LTVRNAHAQLSGDVPIRKARLQHAQDLGLARGEN
jgi:hypothetical protein